MNHTVIFDPRKGFGTISNLRTMTDCTVVKREDQWWMFACGIEKGARKTNFYSASLPAGASLSAEGWTITSDPLDPGTATLLADNKESFWWDGEGGRHCPSYVRGWDSQQKRWIERIYYAGAAHNMFGPYSIGYLEWDGAQWAEQSAPVFTANEYWEHGSVYEPNLIYHDGLWKMWYVAGANQDDYLVQGYAESPDGRTNWSRHQIVFAAEDKVFDFCILEVKDGYEAIFARVDVGGAGLPKTGLWWTHASTLSPDMAKWSEPVRISEPGPWKPVLRYSETDPNTMFVFHDRIYPNTSGIGSPFHFTLECIQTERSD